MKHAPQHVRLPHHVQAAVDFLKSLGAEILEARRSRRVKVSWRVGKWIASITIPANGHAERLARAACDHIRLLFAQQGRAVA